MRPGGLLGGTRLDKGQNNRNIYEIPGLYEGLGEESYSNAYFQDLPASPAKRMAGLELILSVLNR